MATYITLYTVLHFYLVIQWKPDNRKRKGYCRIVNLCGQSLSLSPHAKVSEYTSFMPWELCSNPVIEVKGVGSEGRKEGLNVER